MTGDPILADAIVAVSDQSIQISGGMIRVDNTQNRHQSAFSYDT
jgi:hypothetical protein